MSSGPTPINPVGPICVRTIAPTNARDRRAPTLREIARTGPYMHDGSIVSLEDVVEYYNRGGNANPNLDAELRPLKLTMSEKRSLVAFLHALNGTVSGR